MLLSTPIAVENLAMGTPPPAGATGLNFVKVAYESAGVATPSVAAYPPYNAAQLASLVGGTVLDKLTADLSLAGYARNGGLFLALAPSSPVAVDLTGTAWASPAWSGDTFFRSVNEVIFNNPGPNDVTVRPSGTYPFAGPLSGTSPGFTVPAGGKERWHSPAGWPVTQLARSLTFDPGPSAAALGVCFGGS